MGIRRQKLESKSVEDKEYCVKAIGLSRCRCEIGCRSNYRLRGIISRVYTLLRVSHRGGWLAVCGSRLRLIVYTSRLGEDGTINATSPILGMYVEISSCQAYEGLLSPMVGSNSLVRGGDSYTIKINYVDR
ncbi:hypothetical protein V6N11_051768 [Hibiscus sabdariffa]|uniref:Uncharacterized protein n=1 Tax=Hibiscus sabdariffa TaxID=183260 RepID=A0ABR2U868_9ROSI